jgi:hypothetical protein
MSCDEIRAALSAFNVCEETDNGSRIATHCLYPSFEPVHIYVAKIGDGFRVHDGRGAFDAAWLHGRDTNIIARALTTECARFHLSISNDAIIANISSADWLLGAILSVANASAAVANNAVARMVAAAEEALVDKIQRSLTRTFGANGFKKDFVIRGRSGGERHFDFVVPGPAESELLINGVSPHHSSISAKYVAFADADVDQDHKFAVFDRVLETDDAALLQQVASVVPLASLPAGAQRALVNG